MEIFITNNPTKIPKKKGVFYQRINSVETKNCHFSDYFKIISFPLKKPLSVRVLKLSKK